MLVAVITALGTIVVSLIALFGPRIDARDDRNKLAKDIEMLAKLPVGSRSWRLLEQHVLDSMMDLTVDEQKRRYRRTATKLQRRSLVSGIAAFVTAILMGSQRAGSFPAYARAMYDGLLPPLLATRLLASAAWGLTAITLRQKADQRGKRIWQQKIAELTANVPTQTGPRPQPDAGGKPEPDAGGKTDE